MAVTCSALIWIHPQLLRGPKQKFIVLQNQYQDTESVVYEIFVTQVKNLEKRWVKPLPNDTKFVTGMKDVGVWKKRLMWLTKSGFSLVCSDFSIAPQHAKCVKRGVPELWKTGEKAEDGGPETLKEVTLLAASRARLSDTQWSTGTGLVLCDAQHWSKAYRSTFLESPFCGSWKERGVSRRSGLKCPLTSLLGQGCSWL